jgi:hypothetical protein
MGSVKNLDTTLLHALVTCTAVVLLNILEL